MIIFETKASLPNKIQINLFLDALQHKNASSLVNLFISNPPLLNYEHPNDCKDTDYF